MAFCLFVLIYIITKLSVISAFALISYSLYNKINLTISNSISLKNEKDILKDAEISQLMQNLQIKKLENNNINLKINSILESEKASIENYKNHKISHIISIKNQKISSIKDYCENIKLSSITNFKKSIRLSIINKVKQI